MVSLGDRQIHLIQYLLLKDEYVTIADLASRFDVSARTIRYDLSSIKTYLKLNDIEMNTVPRHGVRIKAAQKQKIAILAKLEGARSVSASDCVPAMAAFLLVQENSTYASLAEACRISRQSVVKAFPDVERLLAGHRIVVHKERGRGLSVEGCEVAVRDAFSAVLDEDPLAVELIAVLPFRSQADREKAHAILQSVETALSLSYFESELVELLIAFCLYRARCGHMLGQGALPEHLRSIGELPDYARYAKALSPFALEPIERTYLIWLLMNGKVRYPDDGTANEGDARGIALFLMEKLEALHPIEDDERQRFLSGLSTHLGVALYRLRNRVPITCEILDEIRIGIPLIYEYTRQQLLLCEKDYGVTFDENEVAFIAMYVASAYETSVRVTSAVRVMIVCPFGMTAGTILFSRIRQMVPDCELVGPFSRKEAKSYLENGDVDLIISTADECYDGYPVLRVSPLLHKDDAELIRSQLYQISYAKMCSSFMRGYCMLVERNRGKTYLHELMDIGDMRILDAVPSWKEAIRIAAEPLIRKGKLESRYVGCMTDAVIELGTYMVLLPETAFVHAGTEDGIHEDCSALLVLRNPVVFGDRGAKLVRTIVVLGVKNREKTILLDLVDIFSKDANRRVLAQDFVTKEIIANLHN
ncbi:PRD domain-containing protein [Coriobacteriales bacterium OH1046]|nr:PRD domain-containing protein [Coriobacteriales bacterium OH1046]